MWQERNHNGIETSRDQPGREPAARDQGRAMAIFAHFSVVFGVPVFLAVLWKRDDTFALHHGRAAALIYVLSVSLVVLTAWSCAFFLPLVFLCYIPALIGIYRAACGLPAGAGGLGNLGDKWLGMIKVRE